MGKILDTYIQNTPGSAAAQMRAERSVMGGNSRGAFVGSLFLLTFTLVAFVTWAAAQGIPGMQVVGYADRLSVQPGETIKFMVSSELPTYRADIVRLIHGDQNPEGPGFKEEIINAAVNREYPGRHQDLRAGSYAVVPDSSSLQQTGSITLAAWIAPTTPLNGVQGIITKWSATNSLGYGLFIDEDGSLALWLGEKDGEIEKIRTGVPLRAWVPANVWPGVNRRGILTP